MSSMLSAPATIPATSEATFSPAFAPLSVGTAQLLLGQLLEPRGPGQRQDRDQPGRRHEIRIIEHRRGRSRRVAKLHLRDALRAGGNRTLEKSDFPST